MKQKLPVLILLIGIGLLKLPLENRLTATLKEQRLLDGGLDLSLRESLGQMGFAASLGGLRSLIASITYLQAYTAFENIDWGTVDSLMTLTTRLQPYEPTYWEDASWHMAYNAATNYKRNPELRAAMRDKLFRDHVSRGIAILEEGLNYLPNDPRLLSRLGDIYHDRQPDPKLAAEYYLKAYAHGAKSFYERMGAYELVKLDDRASWEKAYAILKRYYDNGARYASIMRDLPDLEAKLGVPPDQRIPLPAKPPGR
ncbi:MAG: hypothetical protein RL693_962 [Verrucomicrobiota bacterium]|jgi:hypothetical protein